MHGVLDWLNCGGIQLLNNPIPWSAVLAIVTQKSQSQAQASLSIKVLEA